MPLHQRTRLPRLYAFSGAGLSAESGIETFRTGSKAGSGLWTQAKKNEVCNYLTWRENREAVFRFYNDRIEAYRDVRPNTAHQLLAGWQGRWGSRRVRLLTQNVDDLLEQAGASYVTHLHGDRHSMRCTSCDLIFPKAGELYRLDEACFRCGAVDTVKPGIVMFYEDAPAYLNLQAMQQEMTDEDIFLAVGTTFEVIAPELILPLGRQRQHERNFLVDPEPRRSEFFGRIEAESATVGLTKLESYIQALMVA